MYNEVEEKLIQENLDNAKTRLGIERSNREFDLLKTQFVEELKQGKNVSATFNKLVKSINGLPDDSGNLIMKRAIDVAGLAATSKAPYLYGQMKQSLTLANNRLSNLGKMDKGVSAMLERAVLAYEKRVSGIKDPEIHRGCTMLISALKTTLGSVKTKIINTPTTTSLAQESYIIDEQELANIIDTFLERAELAGIDITNVMLQENLRSTVRGVTTKVQHAVGTVARNVNTVVDTTVVEHKKRELMQVRKDVMEGRTPITRYIKAAAMLVAVDVGAVPVTLGIPMLIRSVKRYRRMRNMERVNLINELRTEMEIINEKIKDAEADNDRQKKYAYIRLRREIQRGIDQLRYNGRLNIERTSPFKV